MLGESWGDDEDYSADTSGGRSVCGWVGWCVPELNWGLAGLMLGLTSPATMAGSSFWWMRKT